MRFYVSCESVFPERNIIEIRDTKELHHIRDVMRLKKYISVNVFDGRGKEYLGNIKKIDRNLIVIEIIKTMDFKKDIPYKVTLYQAIPKKNKMDFIVEKSIELGVDTIVPIVTERTLASIPKEKVHKKRERWMRISKEASKQCGRNTLPTISEVISFNNALVSAKKSDMVIFAALDKERKRLKEILKHSNPQKIAIFIGPEGDFSQNEISMAKDAGYSICSLGPLVLRVEVASVYILSCLNYEYIIK